MAFWGKSPTFATDRRIESCRYRKLLLCFEIGSVVELMAQESSSDRFIACTHHYRTAAKTLVFPNQLELIETSYFVVITRSHGLGFRSVVAI
jgi:hypothetical protein